MLRPRELFSRNGVRNVSSQIWASRSDISMGKAVEDLWGWELGNGASCMGYP